MGQATSKENSKKQKGRGGVFSIRVTDLPPLSTKVVEIPKNRPGFVLSVFSLVATLLIAFFGWKISTDMNQVNVEQQKISWTVSLLAQISSENPRLQQNASLVLRDLHEKKIFPSHLLPALEKAVFDPRTDPDAAKVFKALLSERGYPHHIQLGSNIFRDVLFPLSYDNNRFFIFSTEEGRLQVYVIAADRERAEFEVVKNTPNANSFSNAFTTNSGVLVVSRLDNGDLIYKLTVAQDIIRILFEGSTRQIDTKITREEISLNGSKLRSNQIVGSPVGIALFKNGGFAIGSTDLPSSVMELIKRVRALQ